MSGIRAKGNLKPDFLLLINHYLVKIMTEIRLAWEPDSLVPADYLEECLRTYTNFKGGVTLLRNGTVLFVKSSVDDIDDARKCLNEARFLTDFEVQLMDDKNYLIIFHPAVSVFVSAEEFASRREDIVSKINELKFPSEVFFHNSNNGSDRILLGLYGRGKLQRDCYEFSYLKRL